VKLSVVRRDKIRIVDYDRSWPDLFEAQRPVVTEALKILPGQTGRTHRQYLSAGLPAKAKIDMLAVVANYDSAGQAVVRLTNASWVLAPEPGDREARKYSICHPTIQQRSHHLHVIEPNWVGGTCCCSATTCASIRLWRLTTPR
jgi:GrpB-like predicted nucleotidyltransferase (UPF0157 family)